MAKAGFWLRGAKGKLAGASMQKGANGNTIMREIVTPRNPRTNAQLYQRAIMATVMKAYSAGKAIFDHSFQGYAVGTENQRRFMSENAKSLRSLIAADIDNAVAVAVQQGRVVAPGVSMPVPGKYKVSEGSLINTLIVNNTVAQAASENETVAEYCARLGVQANDLYTIVGFGIPANATPVFELLNGADAYSKQYPCNFYYARYSVREDALTSTDVITNLGQVLEFNEGNFNPTTIAAVLPGDGIEITSLMPADSLADHTDAVIRSRVNEDLRSTETMVFTLNLGWGIASSYALAAWKQGTVSVGTSDLILEGGDE